MSDQVPIRALVERLYPYAYSIVNSGNDTAIAAYRTELPFVVHEYDSGRELNGWRVTPGWTVSKAEIRKDGKLIYDGARSPLGVIARSASFSGRIPLADLKTHLFVSDVDPDAIVYHWSKLYRVEEDLWGFCMPRRLYEQLEDGWYDVDLSVETVPGTMKVLDYRLQGDSDETIVINGHNCHPFQANDDISGCAVGIAVMKRLAQLSNRRFTYRLVIAPEIVGPAFWLDEGCECPSDIIAAILLKSVGNERDLQLQESFTGAALVDRAAHHVFRRRYGTYKSGGFRTIYGNDETVFEAPGFTIPTISLTRWPFDEYHTDRDTPDRLSESRLQDSVDATFEIAMAMERAVTLSYRGRGLVCLSHPCYDLYRRAPAPGLDKNGYSPELQRWNLLMNRFPRDLDGATDLLTLADRYELPLDEVHSYAMSWVAKGLAESVSETA